MWKELIMWLAKTARILWRKAAARDHYWADVPALGDNTVRVGPKVLEQYRDVLMTSGAWGTMVIEYDATYEIKSRKYPFYVREFTPLQFTRLDLDDYVEKRPLFGEAEWLDLLVQSIGFNPARFSRRVKILMLLRLVPFVEANYNLIELGPRETGKTYTFRNTSNRSFMVSGGKATPATLFYNNVTTCDDSMPAVCAILFERPPPIPDRTRTTRIAQPGSFGD